MKLLIVLAVVVACALARPEDHYDDKFDNIDVDELIGSERLLKGYANCFLEKGKCTPEGKEVNKLIPEATTSSCGKCTEKQKILAAKTINAMKTKLPQEYSELIKKHDPEGKHGDELQKFIDTYGA
ncbi:allergen Tha p 1-like [Anticarsia gemmatalis]|uniref:allergen Tha p 1-like n=1 Tax=Anticarsia gemmatalis TaxID=129554 RepID=UPI003F777A18